MTFDSLQPDPSIEAGVQAMVGQMRRMKALAPPPEANRSRRRSPRRAR